LQERAAIHITIFILLRLQEICELNFEEDKTYNNKEKNNVVFWIYTKSEKKVLQPIFIPKLEDKRICPCTVIKILLDANIKMFNLLIKKSNRENNGKVSACYLNKQGNVSMKPYIFLDIQFNKQLLPSRMEKLLKNFLVEKLKIVGFGGYTYKHAVVAYLISHV
jgi:hypothetical protein